MDTGLQITIAEIRDVIHEVAVEMMATLEEPIPPFDTRYPERLESCLAMPFQSAFGEEIYKTVHDKAAALFYVMSKSHPFKNGNKRIAVVTLLYYLAKNALAIKTSPDDLYKMAITVAESEANKYQPVILSFSRFLNKNCISYDKWMESAERG